MDDQELDLLRQRIAYLDECVERCMEEIAALQMRVAMLEARPVAVPAPSTESDRAPSVTFGIQSGREMPTPIAWENDQRKRE
jgi:hypothetical protein